VAGLCAPSTPALGEVTLNVRGKSAAGEGKDEITAEQHQPGPLGSGVLSPGGESGGTRGGRNHASSWEPIIRQVTAVKAEYHFHTIDGGVASTVKDGRKTKETFSKIQEDTVEDEQNSGVAGGPRGRLFGARSGRTRAGQSRSEGKSRGRWRRRSGKKKDGLLRGRLPALRA